MQVSSEPATQIDIPDNSQPDGVFRLELPYEQKNAQAGNTSFLPFFLFLLFIVSLYIVFSTIGQPDLLCTRKDSTPSHEQCLWRAKIAVIGSGIIVLVLLFLTLKFAFLREKINKSGKQFIRITPTEFQNYRLAAPIKFANVTKLSAEWTGSSRSTIAPPFPSRYYFTCVSPQNWRSAKRSTARGCSAGKMYLLYQYLASQMAAAFSKELHCCAKRRNRLGQSIGHDGIVHERDHEFHGEEVILSFIVVTPEKCERIFSGIARDSVPKMQRSRIAFGRPE